MLQLQVGGQRENSSLQLSRLQARQGRDAKGKVAESAQDYNWMGILQPHRPWTNLRGSATQQQQQPQMPSVAQACPATVGEMSAPLHWGTTT
jgi:hypothetical protein